MPPFVDPLALRRPMFLLAIGRTATPVMALLGCLATMVLTACGAASLPEQPRPGEPPFTAEQIRLATPEGRRYRYRIEQPGKPPFIQLIEFVQVDAEGATLRQRSMAEPPTQAAVAKPAAGDVAQARVTWAELAAHGRTAAADTQVAYAQTTVPGGTFDCLRYTMRKGAVVTRSWFARRLPGAPVRQVVLRDGSRAFRMTLLDHHPPLPPRSPRSPRPDG